MSGTTQAFLAGDVLLVVAGLVAWWTWHVRRTTVVWMRQAESRLAHAIPKAELRARLGQVDPIAHCGALPVAELVRDDGAERGAACVRAVPARERGST